MFIHVEIDVVLALSLGRSIAWSLQGQCRRATNGDSGRRNLRRLGMEWPKELNAKGIYDGIRKRPGWGLGCGHIPVGGPLRGNC